MARSLDLLTLETLSKVTESIAGPPGCPAHSGRETPKNDRLYPPGRSL
jgi:hypothetical protein